MSYHDQVPWFATSNGVIDLKTSADFRDKKYTNNDINHNNNENSNKEIPSKSQDKPNSSDDKVKRLNAVGVGGLPPLIKSERRQSKISVDTNGDPKRGPPPPKDNELYGDILVIPPIKQKHAEQDFENYTYSRNLEWAWVSCWLV